MRSMFCRHYLLLLSMRLLIDECIPVRFAHSLEGVDAATVVAMGWRGTKNGELLRLAAKHGFTVFITIDQNLSYQQNLQTYPLAILMLKPKSNRLQDLLPFAPKILHVLSQVKSGQCYPIEETL